MNKEQEIHEMIKRHFPNSKKKVCYSGIALKMECADMEEQKRNGVDMLNKLNSKMRSKNV